MTITTPRPTYTPRDRRKCTHKCVGGNTCISDAMHEHAYHLCQDVDCVCKLAMRGAVTYDERPRRQRVERSLAVGNQLDLHKLMEAIGGKRVRAGVSRAPYAPRGGKNTG